MIPPDRANQAGYNPTHFAKAQPPYHYRDINRPPTYYPETRRSIAHKDLLPRTGPRGHKAGQEDHVCDSTHSSDAPLIGTVWKSTSKPDTAPIIRSKAENPSGERGAGQAETARAVHRYGALQFTFAPLGQTALNHRTY